MKAVIVDVVVVPPQGEEHGDIHAQVEQGVGQGLFLQHLVQQEIHADVGYLVQKEQLDHAEDGLDAVPKDFRGTGLGMTHWMPPL